MEPLIQFYQTNALNQKIFHTKLIPGFIKFQPIAGKPTGTILTIGDNQEFPNELKQENASVIINSEYFKNPYYISYTPLGFNLYELKDRNLYRIYIEDFWIRNQGIINAILSFISQDENKEHQFSVEALARELSSKFEKQIIWSEMQDIIDKIINMLIDEDVVLKGQKQGELCISFSTKTAKALTDNRYQLM